MSAFDVQVDYFSTPSANNVDEFLYGDPLPALTHVEWKSWDVCIYDCIVKSKELMAKVDDTESPLVWLLPALSYQDELKQLLQSSLKQLYPQQTTNLLFYGSSSAHALIDLAKKNEWEKVTVIAIDATYKANAQTQYGYQGVGGLLATLQAKSYGWSQTSFELAPSIDFEKHNQLDGMFLRLVEQTKKPVDIIFAPGNGINHNSDVWLNSLQLLSPLINEHTHYELPNYKLGNIGALEGLVNLYQLTTSPAIVNHCEHALMISQEQLKHQSASEYLWISEEVHN